MAFWTKTKSQRIFSKVKAAHTALAGYNEEHERKIHAAKGSDMTEHADAKAAERTLAGVMGVFASFSDRRSRRRR